MAALTLHATPVWGPSSSAVDRTEPLEEDPDLSLLQQPMDAWEGEDMDTCAEADSCYQVYDDGDGDPYGEGFFYFQGGACHHRWIARTDRINS